MGYFIYKKGKGLEYIKHPDEDDFSWSEWWSTIAQCVILMVLAAAILGFFGSCTTVRSAEQYTQHTAKVDSMMQKDSVYHSQMQTDSIVRNTMADTRVENTSSVLDSVVVNTEKETCVTVVVDTAGNVISKNTVTTITRDRDHWRNNLMFTAVQTSLRDSFGKTNHLLVQDCTLNMEKIVHQDSLLSNSTTEKVVEKPRTFLDVLGDIYNALCAIVLIGFVVYGAWKLKKYIIL